MTIMTDGTTTVRYYAKRKPGQKYSVALATYNKDGKETNPREQVGGLFTASELLEWYYYAKQSWKEAHDIDDVMMFI